MPQEQTKTEEPSAPQDEAGKLAAIDNLLGIKTEQPAPDESPPADDGKPKEKTLAELLAEGESPPTETSESEQSVKPPKTLKELAERSGIKVEDLYAMEIPSADDGGESRTLGQLKDDFSKQVDFAGRELTLSEREVNFGHEQARARAELEIVLAALPEGAIKPEVLAKARREREVLLNREAARTLDVIPEWSNDETKATDKAGIAEHLKKYGFSENHLDLISDHRMLRYMRDNYNRMKLVEKAMAQVKDVTPKPKSSSTKPAAPKPKIEATPDSPQSVQLAAIDQLLKEG